MNYTLSDLQPGTIWMQNKTPDNQTNLIIKIETAPHSVVRHVYGRYGGNKQYTREFPIMPDDPVIELARVGVWPQVLTRYLICSRQDLMNKVTRRDAYSMIRHYQLIS